MVPNDNPQATAPAEPLSAERLAEIRARVEAATPGPWLLDDEATVVSISATHIPLADAWEPTDESRNGEFIAAARTDVPDLLAEVARLREFERRVTEELAAAEEAEDSDPDTPLAARLVIALFRDAVRGDR